MYFGNRFDLGSSSLRGGSRAAGQQLPKTIEFFDAREVDRDAAAPSTEIGRAHV